MFPELRIEMVELAEISGSSLGDIFFKELSVNNVTEWPLNITLAGYLLLVEVFTLRPKKPFRKMLLKNTNPRPEIC